MQARITAAGPAVWIPVLALLVNLFSEAATAGPGTPLQCFANGGVSTPPARVEGLSENIGDLVVTCTGGIPTAAGGAIPTVNIQIFLNTSLTSRLLSTTWSEALLLIGDPTPATQRVCGTTGDIEAGGVCTITGTGTGIGVYNGTAGRPNVFQGIQTVSNSVTFLGIPIDPPGAGGSRILRFTNIRANANALGLGVTPTPIVETISPTPPQFLPVSNPSQTVAFIQRGLTASLSAAPGFSQCSAQNLSLAGDPGQSGTSQFSVRLTENFATAFKRRNVATSSATPTALANQNDLTVGTYNTETGFFNSSFPTIAGRGNLGVAGLADQGTRFLISFSNIPAGVSLFSQVLASVSGGTDVVRRVSTDAVGSGPYLQVSGNAFGIAPITLAGGSGTAVFEVIQSDPSQFANVDIPIFVAYGAIPGLGTGVVRADLAPLSSVTVADAIAPVPRFAATATPLNAFTISACSVDIDGNSSYDALTDGLLILRYLFGLTGTSLTNGAIGTGATRTTSTPIVQYLDIINPALDIDGNGQSDALSDGLMLIRYLFGLRGNSLIAGAVGSGATRTTSTQIETYIQTLMP